MSQTLKEFNEKFRVSELLIVSTEHWNWSVRPVHSTLGAGILSLKRFCESFGDLTPEEATDLGVATKIITDRLRKAFRPQRMNYVMLMMVDDHLHFHVLPRYSETKEFDGLTWKDSGWPALPAMGDYEDRADSPSLLAVRDALK